VIGAARGFVYGGALDLFAHCDLRLCVQGCRFCMPPNRHGFLYPDAGLERLMQVTGLAAATDLLLTAESIDSARALAVGLVQRVSTAEAFESDLQSVCASIVRNAPLARLAGRGAAAGADEDAMYDRIGRCLDSADCREALQAFRDKREPRFALQRNQDHHKETEA
jgi:enoyl-CoA hydratase/carnithine racemase